MDPNTRALIMGAAGAGGAEKLYVEDVFSTWLYTGNGSTQTITNGINLSGKGGLIVSKGRSSSIYEWEWRDTARTGGVNKYVSSNNSLAQYSDSSVVALSTGYSYGQPDQGFYNINNITYVDYTFRKAAKFFDVVTYTGNGIGGKQVAHNLGVAPGCVIVKRTDTTGTWCTYHRGLTSNSYYLLLNGTDAQNFSPSVWNNVTPTSTYFELGSNSDVNANGGTYVAYLFAHDAGGFGDSGNESVIKCGSFTTGSGGTATVDLGWEPQWLLVKCSSTTQRWILYDVMRGFSMTTNVELYPNASDADQVFSVNRINPTATGFQAGGVSSSPFFASQTYIYIAIRRGPMKTPTDATKVYKGITRTGTGAAATISGVGFPPDLALFHPRIGTERSAFDRLRGDAVLQTTWTGEEYGNQLGNLFGGTMDGISIAGAQISNTIYNANGTAYANHFFRRAPGFFDVVAYTGTGSTRTVSHNLGVAPEFIIVKKRAGTVLFDWICYFSSLGNTRGISLNSTGGSYVESTIWSNTSPSSTAFTLGNSGSVNASGDTYIAYLFASCPGVSKCFSYTGNGSSQTINCGFTAGARFVLIKRTDSTGNWLVADTARGLVSGNDPLLYLNSTAAEVTTLDWIDPDNTGFVVNQESTANANVNNATYIGLAIA